ncbi:MAG: hypothetical protein AAF938_30715, partial [Myxococcota bacterium]
RVNEVLEEDEVNAVLRETFDGGGSKKRSTAKSKTKKSKKPDHYDVICISLYKEDLARLNEKVAYLKAQGHRKMSRSALIRFALDTVDLDALPRSY